MFGDMKLRAIFCGILLLALPSVCLAQGGSSTIIGTLTDQSGAVVPQARITVAERATGATQTVSSNETGLFRVLNLLPGQYSLHAELQGFKALDIKEIVLASSETRDLGRLTMQLGTITEEVSVTATATPVQTASSERSALIDSNQLQDVALKGRDPFGFLRLLPGVVDTATDRSVAGPGAIANININGMASNDKNVSFDGVPQLDTGGANAVYVSPSMDAVGEIRVLANAYQAEYGRTIGGEINLVTKSGTKQFHGTAFWNRRHEDMNANSFFNNRQNIQRPLYRYFIGGGTIGGPIYVPGHFNTAKNKLFFFWSEEFTRIAQPTVTSTANLPTTLERGGDFSQSRNSVGAVIPIIDPQTGQQFPGNLIPANRIDPTGQAILNLFMKPNGYVNPAPGQQFSANFLASATPFRHRRDDIVRIDANFIPHTLIYVRWGNDTSDTASEFSVSPGVGPLDQFQPGYNWSGHVVNMISPTLVNEFIIGVGHNNFGWVRANGDLDSNYYRTSSLNPPTLRPLPQNDLYPPYLPSDSFAGGQLANPGAFTPSTIIAGIFPLPYKNSNDNYSFQDDVSKVSGNHSLKAGVYFERNVKTEPLIGALYAGSFNFGSNVNNPLDTGNGYANALLGIFQTYTEANKRVIPNATYNQVEGYVQDSWRANRRLTVDAGVRWYQIGVLGDSGGSYAHFYPQLWSAGSAARIYAPAIVNGKSVALDRATGNTTFPALVNTIVPGSGDPVNGIRVNGVTGNGDFTDFPGVVFGPRFGLAWDVTGDGKTAIRAAAGVFYNRPTYNWFPGRGTQPVVYQPTVYYTSISSIPQAAASAAISPTAATSIAGEQKVERSQQFNLTVQRDIGFNTVIDVAYVGNFDRHAQVTRQLNPVPQGAYANPANIFNNTEINPNLLRTAYPGMGSILYYADGLSAVNYHALQLNVQHRMKHGLQFGAAYSFSKALGTCGTYNSGNPGCAIGDPYHTDRGWYYGPVQWDLRNVLNMNFVYQIPGVSNEIAKHVLNNWVLSGIISAQTGAPVTPACSSVSPGAVNSDPSLSGVGTGVTAARCQQIADPHNYTHSFFTNFNTSAFTLAAPGTFGNTGIGILRQPGWYNVDLTLDKRIPLGKEGKRVIRARIEAYNVLNHTEFNAIGTTMQLSGTTNLNTQWGQYTGTLPARVLSTTLRFEF
jgi:hypothetical protein